MHVSNAEMALTQVLISRSPTSQSTSLPMLGMDDGPTPMDTSVPKESPSYEQVNPSAPILLYYFQNVMLELIISTLLHLQEAVRPVGSLSDSSSDSSSGSGSSDSETDEPPSNQLTLPLNGKATLICYVFLIP